MPAILRKLPSQNYASRCVLGLCGSYEQDGSKLVAFGHPTVSDGSTEPAVWNTMPCLTVCVRIGPPPIRSIISTTMSSILSRFFGSFGLIAAAGKGW
jgi:hypothetical protein